MKNCVVDSIELTFYFRLLCTLIIYFPLDSPYTFLPSFLSFFIPHISQHTLTSFIFSFRKLSQRTAMLERMDWVVGKKGKVAEILVQDAMSSEDSCLESDGEAE